MLVTGARQKDMGQDMAYLLKYLPVSISFGTLSNKEKAFFTFYFGKTDENTRTHG